MAMALTYTVAPGATSTNLIVFNNRVQGLFQRFGWEHVSQSQFRYPSSNRGSVTFIGAMNCYIPALFCFLVYLIVSRMELAAFTLSGDIDVVHNANAPNAPGNASPAPNPDTYILDNKCPRVTVNAFGRKNLIAWLTQAQKYFPYK